MSGALEVAAAQLWCRRHPDATLEEAFLAGIAWSDEQERL